MIFIGSLVSLPMIHNIVRALWISFIWCWLRANKSGS